jgi:hypothetical protein
MITFASWLEALTGEAHAANVAEREHQAEAARRAAELREARAFAWRRVNLVRAVAAAVTGARNEEAAVAAGRGAMLRAVGWNGATQAQRDVAERFAPVSLAVWTATRPEAADGGEAAAALADFEAWYAGRGTPFLALMEREIPELPLVEV